MIAVLRYLSASPNIRVMSESVSILENASIFKTSFVYWLILDRMLDIINTWLWKFHILLYSSKECCIFCFNRPLVRLKLLTLSPRVPVKMQWQLQSQFSSLTLTSAAWSLPVDVWCRDLGIVFTQNVGLLSLAFFFHGLSLSFHFSGGKCPHFSDSSHQKGCRVSVSPAWCYSLRPTFRLKTFSFFKKAGEGDQQVSFLPFERQPPRESICFW